MLRDGRGGQVPLGRSEEEELAAAASPHRVGYRPGSDLFSKEGLDSTNRAGQLRLLVHCEGCPHFLTMIPPAATIATLQEQVSRQHRELFASSMGDIPSVKIRWLEDSHRHALPLQGTVGALLADREKIYAASRMDFYKAGDEGVMVSRTVDETVSRWRDVCEQTAAELCAAARNEDRQAEVTEGGGLACLLCIALHIGTLVPGDITLQSVHSGLRHLLKDKDSGRSIVEAGCGGQVVALLQVPDPDLAALGAFLCARMAADRRSHATLISWGVVLQLAKALTLSSNPAFRFDVTTTLKLLASNPLSHSFMSDQTVLRALRECARDAKDVLCQAKVIGVVAEAARSGTQKLRDRIGAEGMELIIDKARHSEDESVRRAASQALAALRSQWRNVDSNTIIPAVDEDLMHRSSISTPTMNEQGEAARCAHFEDEVDGSHIREAGGSASAGAKAWITALLGVAQVLHLPCIYCLLPLGISRTCMHLCCLSPCAAQCILDPLAFSVLLG